MSRTCVLALTTIAALGTSCLVGNNALAWDAGVSYSAAGAVSHAVPIADQSVPAEAQSEAAPKTEKQSCWRPGLSRNIGIAEPSCDVFGGSLIAASADPFVDRFGAWDVTELGCSGDKARPNLCVRLFTVAAEFNTPQWLVALNARPIDAVESPVITAAAAWVNGTTPAMGAVMAYGAE